MPTNTLIDFRESVEASVDTWEILNDRGNETGFDFRVPSGVSAISRLRFGVGVDLGASAVAVRLLTAFKLLGEGLKLSGPYYFLGQYGTFGEDTDADTRIIADLVDYHVNIPVNPGQEFQAQAKMLGEDMGAINPLLEVTYNPLFPPGPVRKADVREGDRDSATADSLTAINTDLEGSTKDFVVPAGVSRVIGVAIAPAMDFDAENPFACAIELDGDGLKLPDPVNIAGPTGGFHVAGTGGANSGLLLEPRVVPLSLPVVPSFQIAAQVRTIAEDSGPGTFGIELLYG
jgi:hypothetical protein